MFFLRAFTIVGCPVGTPKMVYKNTFKEENSMGLFLDGPIFWDAAPYFWANCLQTMQRRKRSPQTVVIFRESLPKCPWFRSWNASRLPRYLYHWDLVEGVFLFVTPWKLTYPLKNDGWRCISFWNSPFFRKEFIARKSPLWRFKSCGNCHHVVLLSSIDVLTNLHHWYFT